MRIDDCKNFIYSDVWPDGRISTTWCYTYPDDDCQRLWHSRYAPDFVEDAACEYNLLACDGQSPIDNGWDCETIKVVHFDRHAPVTFKEISSRKHELDGVDKPDGSKTVAWTCWDDEGHWVDVNQFDFTPYTPAYLGMTDAAFSIATEYEGFIS